MAPFRSAQLWSQSTAEVEEQAASILQADPPVASSF